jgi:hypothetical protein
METLSAYHCHRVRFPSFRSLFLFWVHVFNPTCPTSWLNPRQFGFRLVKFCWTSDIANNARDQSVWRIEEKTRKLILSRLSPFTLLTLLVMSSARYIILSCITDISFIDTILAPNFLLLGSINMLVTILSRCLFAKLYFNAYRQNG